jgi:hypothetical protein
VLAPGHDEEILYTVCMGKTRNLSSLFPTIQCDWPLHPHMSTSLEHASSFKTTSPGEAYENEEDALRALHDGEKALVVAMRQDGKRLKFTLRFDNNKYYDCSLKQIRMLSGLRVADDQLRPIAF